MRIAPIFEGMRQFASSPNCDIIRNPSSHNAAELLLTFFVKETNDLSRRTMSMLQAERNQTVSSNTEDTTSIVTRIMIEQWMAQQMEIVQTMQSKILEQQADVPSSRGFLSWTILFKLSLFYCICRSSGF